MDHAKQTVRPIRQPSGALVTQGNEIISAEPLADFIKPLIGKTFPLEDAASAIAMMRDRRAIGKIVVTMED